MTKDKDKYVFNVRYIFIFFLAFVLGILFVTRLINFRATFNNIVILCMIGFAFGYALIISLCGIFGNLNARKYLFLAIIFAIILIATSLYSWLRLSIFDAAPDSFEDALVVARVKKSTPYSLEFDKIRVELGDKTIKLNYGAHYQDNGVKVPTGFRLLGTEIKFRANINKYELGDRAYSSISDKVGYSLVILSDTVEKVGYNPSFGMRAYTFIKDKLSKVVDDEDVVSVEMALIFGDQNNIRSEYYEQYTRTGLVHILAVSGLNTSVFVVVVNTILKKLKVNKYIRFSAVGIVLLLYCTLCNFEASVVRAGIMSMILLAGNDLFGKMNDILTSFSLAGVLILLFNPFRLFDLGFQLSFMCVLSIVTIGGYIEQFFTKCKFPKFLASSLGMTIAVTIGLFPAMSVSFTEISFVSIIANIFAIPLFEFMYMMLLLTLLIAICIPPIEYVLFVPYWILKAIDIMIFSLANLEILIIPVRNLTSLSYVSIVLAMIIARFLMVSIPLKTVIITLLLAVYVVEIAINYSTKYFGYDRLILGTSNMFIESDRTYNLVISDINAAAVVPKGERINDIEYLIVTDYEDSKTARETLYSIAKYYFADYVLLPSKVDFDRIALAKVIYSMDSVKLLDGATYLNVADKEILIVDKECNAFSLDSYSKNSYDIVIIYDPNHAIAGLQSEVIYNLSLDNIKLDPALLPQVENFGDMSEIVEVRL